MTNTTKTVLIACSYVIGAGLISAASYVLGKRNGLRSNITVREIPNGERTREPANAST